MRYFHKSELIKSQYGFIYECNHPLYNKCTLYLREERGLAVIQQRFNSKLKLTWWGPVDQDLADAIYLNTGFCEYFDEVAEEAKYGLYPTMPIRQVMWALRMKPIKKEFWETRF